MPTTGALRCRPPMEPWNCGVAELEHATVGGDQPVAPTVRSGGDAHDRCVQVLAPHGAVERRIPEVEDPAVGRHQPVAAPVRRLRDADDRGIEVLTAHGTGERRGSVVEDAPVARRQHEALVRGGGKCHLFDEGAEARVVLLGLRGRRAGRQAPHRCVRSAIVSRSPRAVTFGLGSIDQDEPFQFSMIGVGGNPEPPPPPNPPSEPTAQHCTELRHVMPLRIPGVEDVGDGRRHVGPGGPVPVLHEDSRCVAIAVGRRPGCPAVRVADAGQAVEVATLRARIRRARRDRPRRAVPVLDQPLIPRGVARIDGKEVGVLLRRAGVAHGPAVVEPPGR